MFNILKIYNHALGLETCKGKPDIKILNGGKDLIIGHLQKEREGFFNQPLEANHKMGELEELNSTGGSTNFTLLDVYTYGHSLISQNFWNNSLAAWITSYYGFDGHGNVRFLMGTNGNIADIYTYDAFGVMLAKTGGDFNNYYFCGEQYDQYIGEYYLRARYYNQNSGRFWTMDNYDGNPEDPMSLHKYLYAWDNSVNRIDPTRKWATFLHKTAVKRKLKGLVSDDDIKILCDMQDLVDGKANQDAAHVYMHAMRDGTHDQTVQEAKDMSNNRVRDLLTKARAAESSKDEKTAMQNLGQAIHTLQDSTSPAHHGFQPWYDYPGGAVNPCEWLHASKESIYPGSGSWLEIATLQAYNYFTGAEEMPPDFFANLGADTLGDEFLPHFQFPELPENWWIDSPIGDLVGF